MKKLFANFKDLTKRHKKLVIFFVVIALLGFGVYMFRTLGPRWSKKDTELTTPSITTSEASTEVTTATTGVPSTEDISAMVSEMVESQVAERLAEMNSTPAVTQVPETTSTKIASEEATATAKAATSNAKESLTEEDTITFYHGENLDVYSVSCMSSAYEAGFYSTFVSGNGRNVSIEVPDNVISISAAVSFRNSNNNLSELSEFEELVLEQTENGTEAQYSIPDLPEGRFDVNCPKFYGVFRLETTDGFEYFSISY